MAVLQTTYGDDFAKGFAGMVANGETSNRISRTVEVSGGLGFGVPAFRSSDHGVNATVAAATFLGITIANYASPPVQATGVQADTYPQYSTAAIMTQGVIWVLASGDTTDGAQVYVGDADPLGAGLFTASSTGNVLLAGWFFEDTVSSGQPVRIAKR